MTSTAAAAGTGAHRAGAGHPAARAVGVGKVFGAGPTRVVALDGVDVAFPRGRFAAIMGPSGSGKSTLMHCLAGLDTVSAGSVWVGDTEITGLGDKALTRLRREQIGFVFQAYNLIPTLTAGENITLPLDLAGARPDPAWLEQVITAVGLGDRLGHRPSELSGGQQQRVACARALAGRPQIVFADEPTGNLDSRAGAEMLGLLRRSVDTLGQSLVMVTHDPAAAAYADRVLFLADGRLVDELDGPTAGGVLERMKQLETAHPTSPDPTSPDPTGADLAGAGPGDPGSRAAGHDPAAAGDAGSTDDRD